MDHRFDDGMIFDGPCRNHLSQRVICYRGDSERQLIHNRLHLCRFGMIQGVDNGDFL